MHPWRKLLRLLGTLGGDSRYRKAQLNDPEVAAMVAAAFDPDAEPKKWVPPVEDWNLDRTLMAMVWTRLGNIAALVARSKSLPDEFPLPETEVDRAKRLVSEAHVKRYDEKLTTTVEAAQSRFAQMSDAELEEYGRMTLELKMSYKRLDEAGKRAALDAWIARQRGPSENNPPASSRMVAEAN